MWLQNRACDIVAQYLLDFMFRLLLFIFASSLSSSAQILHETYFNVIKYGAKSDGVTDNSHAFLEAWNAACNSSVESPAVYIPPETTFLVNPAIFHGPCKAPSVKFLILGNIIAPKSPELWDGKDASQWLAFKDIHGLRVGGSGKGVVDGRGQAWWNQSCKYHPQLENCTNLAPTALKFLGCNSSSIMNVKFINSAQTHILVQKCKNIIVENVTIESPGNSPNTDGIHVQSSHYLWIINSIIASGDDCISIGDYISHVEIRNIQCGPGHGISIGSLGRGGNYVQVENIHVSNAIFKGTTNGARIKTWQVGKGYVRHVVFEKLKFNNVQNPIIIDQNYCEVKGACPEKKTGVEISDVVYRAVGGTSASDIAVNLNCSKTVPCVKLTLESIKLTPSRAGREVTANCRNAYGREDNVVPGPCLL